MIQRDIIPFDKWERRECFAYYSSLPNPWYQVSYELGVTRLHNYTKANAYSFYHTMLWLVHRAVNSVDALRMRVEKGQVVSYGYVIPKWTFRPHGTDQHRITEASPKDLLDDWIKAAPHAENAQLTYAPAVPRQDVVFMDGSPVPFSAATLPLPADHDDCIPRICWSAYHKDASGRLVITLTIQVNQRLVDHYHLGLFHHELNKQIDLLLGK